MSIKKTIKNKLYFVVANYFVVLAKVQLGIWKPRIIVITGSNGKTTTLQMLKSQLGDRAKYSDNANSVFGIPFDILGLKRKKFAPYEWIGLALAAPFKAFHKPFSEKIYVVEADADRPGEGYNLSRLVRPEVMIWLSSDRTHSEGFDKAVASGKFKVVDEAVAFEYGNFAETTSKLCIANGDNPLIQKNLLRCKADVENVSEKELVTYKVSKGGTIFGFGKTEINFKNIILPRKSFYGVLSVIRLLEYLKIKPDLSFTDFKMMPGRSSIFKGEKGITIVDSSYNANFQSVSTIMEMFDQIEGKKKWIVLGDLIEQGNEEKEEHEKVAYLVNQYTFEKIILLGPRMQKYAKPLIKSEVDSFIGPDEVLKHIRANITGEETILFKGARFLEGVIEHLLVDKSKIANLCRQDDIWKKRRKKWGI